jgi:ADP-ribose pyrophosphatase
MDEKTVKTDLIYAGHLFTVERIEVLQPDGKQRVRELVRHPGATALVAVDDQGMILLVRQYRIASGRVMNEIPAGTLNSAEPPEVCAVRELQEETGYKPGRIEPLGGFYVAPGYTTEYIHLFLATDLIESRLPGDEDEFIEVDRVSLADALAMIERGEIVDSKTIIGVLRYARLTGKS